MKKYIKSKAKEIAKDNNFVWVYFHGKLYNDLGNNTNFNGIYHLRITWTEGEYVLFDAVFDEITVSFDDYGSMWELLKEYPME